MDQMGIWAQGQNHHVFGQNYPLNRHGKGMGAMGSRGLGIVMNATHDAL